MRQILLILLFCSLYSAPVGAQSNEATDQSAGNEDAKTEQAASDTSLAALARDADFIGIVQVDDTEYETVRDLPSEGFTILRVLVAYRHPGDVRETPGNVDVHESGFEKDACYYPERRNEGRRYLVFLEKRTGKTPEGEKKTGYQGNRPGCMLPVLVTADNRYALRYPVPGVEIGDRSVIQEIEFADPDAFVTEGASLSYSRVDYMVEQGWLREADDDRHVFTHGIYLSDARRLMDLGAEPQEEEADNQEP